MVPDALDTFYPCPTSALTIFRILSLKKVPKSSIAAFLLGGKKSADKRVQSVDAKGWLKTFTSFN